MIFASKKYALFPHELDWLTFYLIHKKFIDQDWSWYVLKTNDVLFGETSNHNRFYHKYIKRELKIMH